MDATNGENQISEVELISSGVMEERSKPKEIWIPNKNIHTIFQRSQEDSWWDGHSALADNRNLLSQVA